MSGDGGDPQRVLQHALESLWRDIAEHCAAGNIRKSEDLVAKLKQCTFLAGANAVRLAWGKVCFRRPLPFILRALIDAAQAPIAELDLSDNQVGDEHVKLLTTYILNSTHLRLLDLSANLFSPSAADVLRSAAQRKDIRLVGCTPPSPSSSLPPRPKASPSSRARTPPVTADAVGALQEKVDQKVKSLGLQHAGQLEEERDRLMREMALPREGGGGEVLASVRHSLQQRGPSPLPEEKANGHHRFHQESPSRHHHQSPSNMISPMQSKTSQSPQTFGLSNSMLSGEAFFDAPGAEVRKPYTPLRERLASPAQTSNMGSTVADSMMGDDESMILKVTPFRSLNAHALSSKGSPIAFPSRNRVPGNSAPASRDLTSKYTQDLAPPTDERDKEEAFDIAEDVPDAFLIRDYSRAKLTSIDHKDLSRITVLILRQNSIRELTNLPVCLCRLDVSSNLLTSLQGLSGCPELEMLVARDNNIGRISNSLASCRNLRLLMLGKNRIRRVEGLEHLSELTYLDLGHNELATPASVRTLSLNVSLRTLVLAGNPLAHPSGRRRICISNLPSSCTEAGVYALLRPYGAVEGVTILNGRTGKDGRQAAFAVFAECDVVAKACATVLAHQEPQPGMRPFKVEVKGKKGRVLLSRIDGKVDKGALMQMLNLHGIVESLDLSEPSWERSSPQGWVRFEAESSPRLDAAFQRQGTCKVGDMTIRMVSMTAETHYGLADVRMHREATVLFTSGTECAERAKKTLSGLTWQGDTVPLVVRHMPDYQPLILNLLPNLIELDKRLMNHSVKESTPSLHGSAMWSLVDSTGNGSTGALDLSTTAAHRALKSNNSSFERSISMNSPGYAASGRAKQAVKRIGKAQAVKQKQDKTLRKFGLQPAEQGAIVKEHAKRRSRSAPSQPLREEGTQSQSQSQLLTQEDTMATVQAETSANTTLPTPIRPMSRNLVPAAYKRGSRKPNAGGFASIAGDGDAPQRSTSGGGAGGRRSRSTPLRISPTRRLSGRSTSATSALSDPNNASVDSTQGELRSALRRLSSAVVDTAQDRQAERRGVSFSGNTPNDLALEGSILGSMHSDRESTQDFVPHYNAEPLPYAHGTIPSQTSSQPGHVEDDIATSQPSSVSRTLPVGQRQRPGTLGRRPPSPRLTDALTNVEHAAMTPTATPTRDRFSRATDAPSPLVSEKIQLFYDQLQALHTELSHEKGASPHQALLRLLTPKAAEREDRRHEVQLDARHARPGTACPKEVQDWLQMLRDDFIRAHLALKALVVLCAAAKQDEQVRYKGIIEGCGMLADTEVPPLVVKFYKLTEADLNGALPNHPSTQLDAILIMLKQLSDTKTCMKYIFALIQQAQQAPLLEYVTQVKASPLVTKDPASFVL